MPVREILLLGNPKLNEVSATVLHEELDDLIPLVQDLEDTLLDFRQRYNAGRAIASPQIGVMKRLVYMNIEKPVVFINPVLDLRSEEMFDLWDDCMSFPDLLVRVRRHRRCRLTFHDMDGSERVMLLEDSLSELLQHECDHLDGILAVSRAIDPFSFALRSQRHWIR